jgi:hypothetical protein
MSRLTKLNLVLVGMLTLLGIAGICVALWCPGDFDKTYEGCGANEADLLLRVKYQVEGIEGAREYVAHYRQRSRWERLKLKYEELRGFVQLEDVPGPNDQGDCASSGSCSFSPNEVADGVELVIFLEHEYADEFKRGVLIPFIANPIGRIGKISYTASWERP